MTARVQRQAGLTAISRLVTKCVLIEMCTQVEMLVVYSGMAAGVDIETVAVHIIYVQNVCEEYPPS